MTTLTINQFTGFLNNFDSRFIAQAWKHDKHLMEHLHSKFNGLCMGLRNNPDNATSHIQSFITELNLMQREVLAKYIKENY